MVGWVAMRAFEAGLPHDVAGAPINVEEEQRTMIRRVDDLLAVWKPRESESKGVARSVAKLEELKARLQGE